MGIAQQGQHQPQTESGRPAPAQPAPGPELGRALPPENGTEIEPRDQGQHIAKGHRQGSTALRNQGDQQRHRHQQRRIHREQGNKQERQGEGEHKAEGGARRRDQRLQQGQGSLQQAQHHSRGPTRNVIHQMAELLLQKAIRQRGINGWLDPTGDQQHPGEGRQHQQHAKPTTARLPHQSPQPQREQQQPAVFPHQQEQQSKHQHLPDAPFEQPPQHEKAQQRQPDQIVKVLQSRTNHSPAEEIGRRQPLRQGRRQAGNRQLPEHQARQRESRHLEQGESPGAQPGHQRRTDQGEGIGVLTQMQVAHRRQGITHRDSPRQHGREAALERTPLRCGPQLLQKQRLVIGGAEADQTPALKRQTHQKEQGCHPDHPPGWPSGSQQEHRLGFDHRTDSVGPSRTRALSRYSRDEPYNSSSPHS